MNVLTSLKEAIDLPNGARFYRCALQINPFAYLKRHSKKTSYPDERQYNDALIKACLDLSVEAISITDHQRANTGESLCNAAREAGIAVFPGAELETKEGAHFLCLFDPEISRARIAGILGDCGIHDQDNPPPVIKYDVHELLSEAQKWNCVCIAAHVASEKGLLKVLDNQVRATVWKNSLVSACSLPGPTTEAPENLRPILENKNAEYRRSRPVALLNAQDVASPEDLAKPGATCWIKMSAVSVEGFRQAFLDPLSRIRLASDPVAEDHSEFVALTWQGGFLDGASIHFNENLNVLIGGRGTGKSTVIESLRSVLGLEPIGEEAASAHEGIIGNVLRSGTKISLLIRVHRPAKAYYLIERTLPNPPIVRDEDGNVIILKSADVLQNVEIYGQHEISELAKSPERRTKLLDRFIDQDLFLSKRKVELQNLLEKSRGRILEGSKEMEQIDAKLSQLPAIEATLARYQKAGLEEKLKEQSLLVKEEGILKNANDKLSPFRDIFTQLQRSIPIDRTTFTPKALDELPGKPILSKLDAILEAFSTKIEKLAADLKGSIDQAEKDIGALRIQWDSRKQAVSESYEAILRELQKSKIDGAEFIKLRRQIEETKPIKERLMAVKSALDEQATERRNLLVEWEDSKAAEFRLLEKAAKKVNKKLEGRVLVEVVRAGNREPLLGFLDGRVGGRLAETKNALKQLPDFSVTAFVEACRKGKEALTKAYGIPTTQADRLGTLERGLVLELEEIDLPATTSIKLNVAAESQPAQWQTLEELSTGQKATALLLLLLLESRAPLIVDQPEDDLDNRFITEGIVPKMKEEKRRRQFVFATHNANIPVLGDAELIVGLSAAGEADQGKVRIPNRHMGSIDTIAVRQLVEEVLEGGKDAFEMRRLKYGF